MFFWCLNLRTHRNGMLGNFGSFWIKLKFQDAFRRSILGTSWRFFTIFLLLAKRENTVIYSVFLLLTWKKSFLQHAENYVNTSVFARSGPKNIANTVIFATRGKKHCKYRGFGLRGCLKHWYLRCFLLRECQKNAKTPPIWRFFRAHTNAKIRSFWVMLVKF